MPDLGTQIGVARQAGYSDADITAFLSKDPSLGPKVAQAKSAGYSDAEIADHLASSAPKPSENVFQKAARLTGEAYHNADQAYRADVQSVVDKHGGASLIDLAKPVLDAVGAATAPIKGIADATFGDQPAHLPSSIAGVQVPQALQNINSKGLTGGDIATVAIPVAGELAAGAKTAQFAKGAGITARTAEQTLASSKAPVTVARPNPVASTPQNDLAAKATGAPVSSDNALSAGLPKGAVAAVKGDPAATVEALKGAKTAAYQAVDTSGVQYTPQAFSDMVQSIKSDAAADNISPERHPAATSMIADMDRMAKAGTSPTLTELDQLRQVVRRDVASKPDGAEAHFGKQIIDGIDNFVQSAQPQAVSGGNAGTASDLITSARTANAQYRKAEAVTDAVDAAKLRASSTGSGGNADNAIRQNLRRVLETTPNLTADEKAALTGLVSGGPVQNALRFAGKASPATGGLNSLLSLGATTATRGALGVPLMATTGAKFAADAITSGKVNDLLNLIAAGGSRANLQAVQAWQKRLTIAQKAGPNAYASAVGRLRTQMRGNPALAPLYVNAANGLRGAQPVPAAASPTSQAPGSTAAPY